MEVGKPTTGGELLEQLGNVTKQVKGAEPWTAVIEGLKKYVSDVPVHIQYELPEWTKTAGGDPIAGYYDAESHSAHISILNASSPFHTTIHELEHAATALYVRQNPEAPLVKRLGLVLQEAKKRALRMGKLGRDGDSSKLTHYGLTNPREFLSELKSNPRFVDFLSRSEAYASKSWKSVNIFNHLA